MKLPHEYKWDECEHLIGNGWCLHVLRSPEQTLFIDMPVDSGFISKSGCQAISESDYCVLIRDRIRYHYLESKLHEFWKPSLGKISETIEGQQQGKAVVKESLYGPIDKESYAYFYYTKRALQKKDTRPINERKVNV